MGQLTKEQLLTIARARRRRAEAEAQKTDPAQVQLPPPEEPGSILDPFVQGATFGFADEARGAVRGGIDYLTGKAQSFGEGYARNRDAARGDLEAYRERNPIASTVAEVGGALPTAFLPMGPIGAASRGAGLLGKIAGGAAAGGAQGTAYGFGSGEGGLDQRLESAKVGGTWGAMGGGAIPLAARGAGLVARPFSRAPKAAPGIDMAERLATGEEFGVPLSRGQATGNINQQAREQSMRAGTYGGGAQATATGFQRGQSEAADQAIRDMQGEVAGPHPVTTNLAQGGQSAVTGVQNRVSQLEGIGNSQFEAARAANISVMDHAALNAPATIRDALDAAGRQVTPRLGAATDALAAIDKFAMDVGAGRTVSFAKMDEVRRTLTHMKAKGDEREDAAALAIIKNSYLKWMEDAVDNAMFAGDPAGIKDLKKGIATWRILRGITDPMHGPKADPAGPIVAKMANLDVDGMQAAKWLYSATQLGGGGIARNVAKRLKGVLGDTSAEWSDLRQSYLLALTRSGAKVTDQVGDVSDPMAMMKGAQDTASTISKFMNGVPGTRLADVLFSPEELTKIERFGKLMRMMVPDRMATNHPGSGYVANRGLAKLARGAYYTLFAAMGAKAGGMVAGPLGIAGGMAGGIGTAKMFAGLRNSALANKAFRPIGQRAGIGTENAVNAVGGTANRALVPAYPQEDPFKRLPIPY